MNTRKWDPREKLKTRRKHSDTVSRKRTIKRTQKHQDRFESAVGLAISLLDMPQEYLDIMVGGSLRDKFRVAKRLTILSSHEYDPSVSPS